MSSWPFVFAVVLCPAQLILSFFVFGSDSAATPPLLFLVGMRSKINYEKPSFRRMACMRMGASDVFSHA